MEKETMKDLGWRNSWYSGIPEEVLKCQQAGHVMSETNAGNCVTKSSCEICNIFYKTDSSD